MSDYLWVEASTDGASRLRCDRRHDQLEQNTAGRHLKTCGIMRPSQEAQLERSKVEQCLLRQTGAKTFETTVFACPCEKTEENLSHEWSQIIANEGRSVQSWRSEERAVMNRTKLPLCDRVT